MQEIKPIRIRFFVIFIFAVIGFVIYAPVIGNGFLSDDYDSLYRIYIQKRILYREFLRPMIDISFYLNYLVSGLSPWSYYIFNISVHIVNALLLFRFVSGYTLFSRKDQLFFAIMSGFLFLIYPFHNESISWLSGRLSSMACFFALLSLIIVNEREGKTASFISAIFFLLGLLCYESIIFLPLIILTIQWLKDRSVKKICFHGGFWIVVTGFYLVTRLLLSGEITGDYGGRLSDYHIKQKFLNAGKVFGRLFLPGSENQRLLIILTIVIGFFIMLTTSFVLRNITRNNADRKKWLSLVIFAIISLIIPVAFGVSTRTSESDRLLYFPSCFICMLITCTILWIFKNKSVRLVCFAFISIYFLCFLELNNRQWVKASKAAGVILESVRNRGTKNIILINIPDELEGAYVFRNGLVKALIINKMDTSSVKIMNYLKRQDYLKVGKTIPVLLQDSIRIIYPDFLIVQHEGYNILLTNSQNNSTESIQKNRNLIYYWNKEALIRLL
jgi:protein O-mannosyl-transferase